METGLQGKTALLTGGSSGIGKGIALALAAEGVRLAIASRRPDPAALDEIAAVGGAPVVRIAADVSQEAEVVRMVQEAIAGLGHLDFYINNAAWTWHQPITQLDSNAWFSTLNTNLSAAAWATREVSRHMIARRSGSLVFIASTNSYEGEMLQAPYNASKGGLWLLTKTLARELGPHGIRSNAVGPGFIRTRLSEPFLHEPAFIRKYLDPSDGAIPLRRLGLPEDVTGPALFLASSDAAFVNGAMLLVDGGQLA